MMKKAREPGLVEIPTLASGSINTLKNESDYPSLSFRRKIVTDKYYNI
jgi:hypothetical protein